MNSFEKIYSLIAVTFAVALISAIMLFPELRQFNHLLYASLLGMAINIGLMFMVLRDIFFRCFDQEKKRYLWIALVLTIWPSVIYYLFRYGFTPRSRKEEMRLFLAESKEK
jgi:hypothetical protein